MIRLDAEERLVALGLNATGAAGLREALRIKELFGDLTRLNGPEAARRIAGGPFPARLKRELGVEPISRRGQREHDEATRLGLSFVLAGDEQYPSRLTCLANPPLVIFYRGELPSPERRCVAVVGSRKCSRYGRQFARDFGADLARRGIAVVSGLARGIDAAAHAGSLDGGGETYAVLGCGLPRIYPPEHRDLADRVATSGGLLTEFGPEVPPLPPNFPRRNRLIAALVDAVVLVEAKARSGGLITVRWAADLGREVFVVPGQVDNPVAEGVLALLRDGVIPTRGAADLCEDMGWVDDAAGAADESVRSKEKGEPLSRDEHRLLHALDHEPVGVDVLLGAIDLTPGQVLTILLSLELRGRVEQLPGMLFRRLPES